MAKIVIIFAPSVIKSLKKYDSRLIADLQDKLIRFQDRDSHESLKVHKLHGRMKDKYSFSINYQYRVVFSWDEHGHAVIEGFGTHDLYE